MEREGKYIYCIIGTRQERNFDSIGMGGREVNTLGYEGLSMVVSNSPMTKYVLSRENMLTHQRVIEEVMKEFTVLPVRFCTLASNADEIRNLLDRRYRELQNLLRDMDHKVELGVKAAWKDVKAIFREILEEDKEIRRLKKVFRKDDAPKDMQFTVEAGKMVEEALRRKKEEEGEKILSVLRRASIEHRLNRTSGDNMFLNAAFLVDGGREKEFDNIMDDLSKDHQERVKFTYVGPLPPYNFVNIVIYPEEWEK